jgi:Zn-dependent M28 family amino/carboxypeptidase
MTIHRAGHSCAKVAGLRPSRWGNAVKNQNKILAILLSITLAACSPPPADEPAPEASAGNTAEDAANQISGEFIRKIVKEIADDRYEGRGPGSRGDVAARQYLARELEALGLEPGGADGSWEQEFVLVSVDSKQPDHWAFQRGDETLTFKQWDDFIVNSDVQQERAEFGDTEVVFVGYGIQAPEFDWDDYKGHDLNGKVLLMMNNDPEWDPDLFGGETRLWYGRWDYKYAKAAAMGAVGAIIIHTTPSAGYPFQVLQTSGNGPQFQLPFGDEPHGQITAWMVEDAAHKLVSMAGFDLDELRESADNRDFEPVPLGVTTSIGMDVEIIKTKSANVLGLIPGSDPELKDEVVIYTAHHDHLGIGKPNEEGDNIYNGAYDNASGVGVVMSIAQGMKALTEAPRRSVLIALVGAEEQGLLGSKYYAENPTFPSGKIAANINYDGGNIWGHTHDVTFVGLGKSTLDQLVKLISAEQGRVVKPDQFPSRGYFYRSDQFSFARTGVPAVYLDPGMDFVDRPEGWGKAQINHFTEVNYHQPSDEYDESWNFDGAVTDAQLGFWTGLAVANADEMPTWNTGDEFEAARLKAISAVDEGSD